MCQRNTLTLTLTLNSLTMLKVKFVNKIDLGDPHLAHVSLDQNDQAFLVTQVSISRNLLPRTLYMSTDCLMG